MPWTSMALQVSNISGMILRHSDSLNVYERGRWVACLLCHTRGHGCRDIIPSGRGINNNTLHVGDGDVAAAWQPGRSGRTRNKGICSKKKLEGIVVYSLPLGIISQLPCPRVRPRRHATQRARSETFKLSLTLDPARDSVLQHGPPADDDTSPRLVPVSD